jgi:hypothetical protein
VHKSSRPCGNTVCGGVPAANAFSKSGNSIEKDLPNTVTLGNVLGLDREAL